jgi:hypothetical protein
MFSILENTIVIPPQFNEEINKNTFRKYKNCNKIIFSNYTLLEHPSTCYFTQNYDFSSKLYKKFYLKNLNVINDFYQKIYFKIKHHANIYENKYRDYNGVNFIESKFNKAIDDKFPDEIKILVLGWNFNQSVDNLPITLKELVFGYKFNKTVDNLPFTLETIVFGQSFNNFINNLPNRLKSIALGKSFNHPIDDLPNTLEKIELGENFNYPINNLPISLLELIILSDYQRQDIYQLPKKLDSITFIPIESSYKSTEKYNSQNIKYKFKNNIYFY